jgi:RNA polymerase sigma-54 factor
MRMSQQMKLAPHMIQSMEILQMPLAALEERIEQELESNATLELVEGGESGAGEDGEPGAGGLGSEGGPAGDSGADPGTAGGEDSVLKLDAEHGTDDFARLDSYEQANPEAADNEYEGRSERDAERDYEDRRARVDDGEPDAKSEAMANTAARAESLAEQLAEQWALSDVDPALRPVGELLVGYIEDDGYIRTPLEVILEKSPPRADGSRPSLAEAERALRAVQLMLDPPGVAARDTRECLLLQIDAREAESPIADPLWETVRAIVESHLEDLANNRLPKVAAKLGLTVEDLKKAVERLKTLSLAPGRALVERKEAPITPDAYVEYDAENDRYYAYLNDRSLPNLRINQEYALMAKDRQVAKPTREFIRTNLGNAQFLIEAIEQRKRTLLRVVEAVVAAQREFFDYGPQAIKPLPMTKVAEQLGIHVATVSRAVAEKHLATPRGTVPLRKFFTGGTVSESGEEVSWDAIKAALQEVIDAEDKSNPLSDDQLAEELKKRGLEIARRTVAKYRGQLGIPTGRLRKAY